MIKYEKTKYLINLKLILKPHYHERQHQDKIFGSGRRRKDVYTRQSQLMWMPNNLHFILSRDPRFHSAKCGVRLAGYLWARDDLSMRQIDIFNVAHDLLPILVLARHLCDIPTSRI